MKTSQISMVHGGREQVRLQCPLEGAVRHYSASLGGVIEVQRIPACACNVQTARIWNYALYMCNYQPRWHLAGRLMQL